MIPLLLIALLSGQAAFADYQRYFERYTELYWADVPYVQWPLIESIAWAESSFNPDAQSPVGAKGVMQIMDGTFRDIQRQVPSIAEHSPFDPQVSINAGTYYLRFGCWNFWKVDRTPEERTKFSLGGYNAGNGNINKAWQKAIDWGLHGHWEDVEQTLLYITGEANSRQTTGYVAKIMPRFERRKKELGLGPAAFVHTALDEAQPDITPVVTPVLPQEEPMEAAVASLGVTSLFELLGQNAAYKVSLLVISILIGVFVPPWSFRVWDRTLPYDTAKLIAGDKDLPGSRLVTAVVIVQMIGIFAICITGLWLLH